MGVHIVLFIKQDGEIDFPKLIDDMYNNYKDIGTGIIIENTNNNPNQPNFIFNKNKELLIDGNNNHIAINIFGSYEDLKKDIMEMLWDAFDVNDIRFTRVGYIKEIVKDKKLFDIEAFKNNMFKNKDILSSQEFQLAFHTNLKYKHDKLNCWKRYINFRNDDFIINYDVNTDNEKEFNITYKYLKEFMEYCEDYIVKDMEGI